MVLGAFVTVAKSISCRRQFSIQASLLGNKGFLVVECPQESTHVLLETRYLQGGGYAFDCAFLAFAMPALIAARCAADSLRPRSLCPRPVCRLLLFPLNA